MRFAIPMVLLLAASGARADTYTMTPSDDWSILEAAEAGDVVEVAPGTAQLVIAACDYVRNPWGDYDELNLGFLARPAGADDWTPGIVVIHEWWGLNEHIEHWADRLAGLGYAALAVDLYGGKVAATSDEAMALVRSVDEAKAMKTLLAAHEMLQRDSRIAAKKTACIGWCFGGGWSLKLALAAKDLDAAVIYYGRLVTDPAELKEIHAKILGIFGNMDNGIPPRVVDEFDKALAEAGVEHEIHRYDANHAFANPSSARYDQKAAADAWVQVQAFLKRAL